MTFLNSNHLTTFVQPSSTMDQMKQLAPNCNGPSTITVTTTNDNDIIQATTV